MINSVTEHFKHSMPTTVCHHFSRVLNSHVYYLNADNSIRCVFASGQPSSQSDDGDLICALFCNKNINGRPVIKNTRPGEAYIAINLFDNNKYCGKLAAGPIVGVSKTSSESKTVAVSAFEYFENAISAAILLHQFVYGEWIDEKELAEVCLQERQTSKNKRPESGLSNSNRQETIHHHSIMFENHLYSLISDGNEKKLIEMIKTPPDGAYGLLDKQHPLRNLKNDCICTITLAARAAITGGLDFETAFSISDEAIQNLELLKDIESLYQLIEQTLSKLTHLVADTKQLNYSYRINRCRNYIANHIYEKITVSSVAAYFGISPEYLSEQYKKETGTRLIDFIQSTRAEEAKKLLLFSNKAILEIASLLNYHDQSHFTKSFKRCFGITPKDFKEAFTYK